MTDHDLNLKNITDRQLLSCVRILKGHAFISTSKYITMSMPNGHRISFFSGEYDIIDSRMNPEEIMLHCNYKNTDAWTKRQDKDKEVLNIIERLKLSLIDIKITELGDLSIYLCDRLIKNNICNLYEFLKITRNEFTSITELNDAMYRRIRRVQNNIIDNLLKYNPQTISSTRFCVPKIKKA